MILLAACGGSRRDAARAAAIPPPQPEENFTAYDSPSLQFLPRQQEAPGWRLEEDPIVVPGDKLGRYLDAESAAFTRYEVVDMTAGKYASLAGRGFASVEIFRFPDFVKAFGAYSQYKKGPIQFLALPNESFGSKHSVHLWRGPFYVRIIGGGTPDGNAALLRLVGSVAERMPVAPAKPAVLNFFPVDTRVVNSERYSAEKGFGQRFLGNSFQATFVIPGSQPIEGLIIPAANKQAATNILNAYRQLYVRNGKLLDPIANLGEDNFTAEDRYLGRAVAFRIDRFVIAFNGYDERQKLVDLAIATNGRIIGSIRKQLVQAEEAAEDAREGRGRTTPENVPAWAQPRR